MGTTRDPDAVEGTTPWKWKEEDQMVVSVGPYTLRKLLLFLINGINAGRNASPPT